MLGASQGLRWRCPTLVLAVDTVALPKRVVAAFAAHNIYFIMAT